MKKKQNKTNKSKTKNSRRKVSAVGLLQPTLIYELGDYRLLQLSV